MPPTRIYFYQESRGGPVPVLVWLLALKRHSPRAFARCISRLERLAAAGYELRRPEGDYLRDGIYELRVREGRVHYRLLYFFHGRNVAVIAHALTKEGGVPPQDVAVALSRKARLEKAVEEHLYQEGTDQ